jgi:Uncharacterized conserved protein (DUF2190)
MAASCTTTSILGVIATAAIAQYQPVQASGAPAVAAGNALGFATVPAASGTRVPVGTGLTVIAVAGAAIAIGAAVEVHSVVTQVVTRTTGVPVGRALTAAAAAGDLIEVMPIPN